MPTLYRKADRKPIPPDAEILTRKGRRHARWTDRLGRARSAPLSDDGTRIVVERPNWYFDHDGHDGRKVGVKGYRDKEATEALARRLERDAARQRQGLAPSVDPARALIPWRTAMEAWLADLERQGCDDMYRANMRRLLTKLAEGCGWSALGGVRGEGVRDWLAEIRRLGVPGTDGKRKPKLPSDRTINQYHEVANRFLRWCCAQDPPYLEANPLGALKKIEQPRRARHRRALGEAEMIRLLAVAGRRAPLYRVAALTGLRRDELRQLQWRDVRLDQARPLILLRPEANKARRADTLPLHPAAAAALGTARPSEVPPLAPVFPEIPTLATFRRDLGRAGVALEDAQGRRVDFHSLRYTFCTLLAKAGVPIRTAMELMRHRDPRLTLQIYCDAGQLETAEAVARLPSLSGPSDGVAG